MNPILSIPYLIESGHRIRVQERVFEPCFFCRTEIMIIAEGIPTEKDLEYLAEHFKVDRVAIDLKFVYIALYWKDGQYWVSVEYSITQGACGEPAAKSLTYPKAVEEIKKLLKTNLDRFDQYSAFARRILKDNSYE